MQVIVNTLHPQALVLLRLAAMLLFAFCFSRVTKLFKLPNVTGYILSGIVIGPYVSGIVSLEMAEGMSFLTDIALAFIAFGTGKFFKWEFIRQSGRGIVLLTMLESLMASLLVTLTMSFVFGLSMPFSLLLGAIASATAPASTLMTIRQYKAKGTFVNTILQVVALDDAVALIAFSVCAAIAQILGNNESIGIGGILMPLVYNAIAIGLGGAAAFALKLLMRHVLSSYNQLLLTVILLIGLTGLCAAVDISPLLSCMVFGTVHANISVGNTVFKRVDRFSPPILTLFFVVSGMRLDVQALATAGIVGVAYFAVRIVGKYLGASLGAALVKSPIEVKRYLGLALIPQAGVSIGLAVLGERILPKDMGALLSTIILSSSVLYEMVGPAAAKLSMHLAGAIPAPAEPNDSAEGQPADIYIAKGWDEDAIHESCAGGEEDAIRLGVDNLFPFRRRRGQ